MLPYIFTDKKAALENNPDDLVFRLRPSRFSVSAISVFNLSHFAVQSQLFCAVISAILPRNMAEIEM